MGQTAVDVLNRWIAETVRPVPPQEIGREAARLGAEFTAYADDAGLQVEEIELDIGQDLTSFMKDALLAAAGDGPGERGPLDD